MSDPMSNILAKATMPPHIIDELIARHDELQPIVQNLVDSLLVMADNREHLALALGLLAVDLLNSIVAHKEAPAS